MIHVNPNRKRMVLEGPEVGKALAHGVFGIGGLVLVELFIFVILSILC